MADATLKDIMGYFKMSSADFKREWPKLTDQDKKDIKAGIGNGTETY